MQKVLEYKAALLLSLDNEDYSKRRQFCGCLLQRIEEIINSPLKPLWIDEIRFGNSGVYKKHNDHYQATDE